MLDAPRRSARTVLSVCAVLCLFFAVTSSASAAGVTVSPPNPVAGDSVTVSGSTTECENNTPHTIDFTFLRQNADGSQTTAADSGPIASPSFTTTLTTPGTYTVSEDFRCPQNTQSPVDHYYTTTQPFTVSPGVSGSIATTPDPPQVNQQTTLTASASGGNAPYTFSWDVDNTGTYTTPSTSRTISTTFTTSGPHVVHVKISDNGLGHYPTTHTTTVTQTITVASPPPPPPPGSPTTSTPAPTPPPCLSQVAFQLSEFTTTGCFTHTGSSPDVWQTTSAVKLNGIPLPDFGQTFTITGPTTAQPGGHLSALNSTIQLDALTIFSGNIDWTLPAGGPGQEGALASFSVAPGAALFGLNIQGSVALELGQDPDGTYYADFPLTIQLPAGFKAGPDPEFGSVTGSASLRVDDAGIHYNGLRLEADNVWIGKLQVENVCFSYVPANGISTAPCDTPPLIGGGTAPFVQCNSDPTTDRWDASAVVDLPSGLQLGAFGGLAGGQLSKLGGSVGGLDRRVPIADGVYLDHVAFGICLSPPPLIIRANVGANFLGNKNLVSLSGGFTYTDGTQFNPWSLDVDGELSIGDLPIGSGNLGIHGNGTVDFNLKAGVDVLNGIASVNGEVYGWVNAPKREFVVGGDVQGCLGAACASAQAELSSTGVAGCVTVGSSLPTYNLIIPLDGGRVHLDTSTYPLTAGFGYDWGASSAQLLGGSCDFSAYEPADFVTALAGRLAHGSAERSVTIASGTSAVALRIHGTHGAPRVTIRGPHGVVITTPSHGLARMKLRHYVIERNPSDGTTDVMIVRPATGVWRIVQQAGTASSLTSIDRAGLQAPPSVAARLSGHGTARRVQVAYSVPAGAKVQLLERAKGVRHVISARLRGHRCVGLPARRPGTTERILCATVPFTVGAGPGGRRQIQALTTRGGIPLQQRNIASFIAPAPGLPGQVGALRVQRGSGGLLVLFTPASSAARYAVSARLGDGRRLAFGLKGGCRALRIPHVGAGLSANVMVAGVRYDLVPGKARSLALKSGARAAGAKAHRGRVTHICR